MRFVFDEHHPVAISEMLLPLIEAEQESYLVTHVVTLGLRGASDVKLLEALRAGDDANVLVTTDKGLRRRPHEQRAVADTGSVIVVGVGGWNQAVSWERARMTLWWWQEIARSAMAARPGTFLELPWRTKLQALSRWQSKGPRRS